MSEKCRPHDWREPTAADYELVCAACGRRFHKHDMTPNMRGAILNSIELRRGPDAWQRFGEWMREPVPEAEAERHYRERYPEPLPAYGRHPLSPDPVDVPQVGFLRPRRARG